MVEDGIGILRYKAEVARGFISPISRRFSGIERRWFMQTKWSRPTTDPFLIGLNLRKNENHVGNVSHCQSFLISAHEISLDMLRLPSLSVRSFLKSYRAGLGRCLGAAFGG